MKLRHVTAASVFAAMAALAGCGQDETTTAEDTYTYGDEEADQTAQETQPYEDTETMETEPFEDTEGMQDDTGLAGSVDRTEERQAEGMTETEMTEFAALDTNSDGAIDEREWQPDAMQGTQFEEVDQDGDGMIDRDEFRQGMAMSDTGGTTGTTGTQGQMPEEGTQQ